MQTTGIGERIKEIRVGVDQGKFGAIYGLTRRKISSYEREEVPPPIDFLTSLAQTNNVNYEWLLTGEGPKFKTEGLYDQIEAGYKKNGAQKPKYYVEEPPGPDYTPDPPELIALVSKLRRVYLSGEDNGQIDALLKSAKAKGTGGVSAQPPLERALIEIFRRLNAENQGKALGQVEEIRRGQNAPNKDAA